jgi:uncharacterized protein YaaN involved in tellurite resistance
VKQGHRAATPHGRLPASEQKKVVDLAARINVGNAESVIDFGTSAQKQISTFYERVLTQVRAKDAHNVADVLDDLLRQLKSVNVNGIGRENLLARIPILGTRAASAVRFANEYERVNGNIQRLSDRLLEARKQLLKDVDVFDRLYAQNVEHLDELSFYVRAVEFKLAKLRKPLPRLKRSAESSDDPMLAHELQDLTGQANRLERKLRELKLTRMIAVQTAGQIRLVQDDVQVLIERIQSSLLNAIPLWRNQIAIALGRHRQRKTVKLQQEIMAVTAEMLKRNSEMLKRGRRASARQSTRNVEAEALERAGSDLVATPNGPPPSDVVEAEPERAKDTASVPLHPIQDGV